MANTWVLTHSQLFAIRDFQEFLDGEGQVLILKGAAGTGKTTLVSEFIKILEARHRPYALMAPTGRAAYILGSKTGRKASTIHRCIYGLSNLKSISQNKDDIDDDSLQLRFGIKTNNDSTVSVYIVDECSMISDSFSENESFSFGSGCLLSDLFEFARGRKIVFVGDYAQLPPVEMNFSPALDKDYIENKFSCQVSEIILREVMRQSSEGVMLSNASKIRDCIERKSFIEFKLEKGFDSEAENVNLLDPYFTLSPNKPNVKSAVITYSNKQALDYNLAIRRHYYGENAPRLKNGDLLIICRNNYSFEYELFNGNIVQVESCQPDNEVIQRQVRVKLGKNHVETVNLKFRNTTIRFAVDGKPASLNVMILDNFLDEPSGAVGRLLSSALMVDFNNRLPEKIKSRLNEIRKLLRSKDKLSVEQQELRDAYIILLNKDPYYNSVVCKYGYAMTCHKAQGGEWENVFVDMCRFGGTANESYFRWVYTALTRASKKIWYFRSPEFNYISNLIVEEIIPSSKIRVSIYTGSSDFCEERFMRIKRMSEDLGISVTDDRSKSYQHIITFTDNKSNMATYQLWYNAKGYSAHDVLLTSSSEEFSSMCKPIIDLSYAPGFVPFHAPDRPFAEKLVAFVRCQLDELNIQLLDITQENYQDVFHLKTDGIAQIGFSYTAKGNYTYMRLTSSLGPLDSKLKALRERFL